MKHRSCFERVLDFASLVLVSTAIAGCCLRVSAVAEAPGKAVPAAQDDLFQSTNILRISIEIPEEGMQSLRRSTPRRSTETKPRAQARVTEGGRLYANVSVQLKGFTTFRPVDSLPGLTLGFDKFSPKQKFHGLAKISLNNSQQDDTRLNEKFSRELFAAAGVPVPRAEYAIVTLNGRELGLYVLVEGFDKQFLKRHFERAEGNLFEAGVLQDIDRPLKVLSGKDRSNNSAVQRLLRASREPDANERWRALEASVDMDRFLAMVAMETILCHSDSYSMNRNNFRIYHDPGSDKIVFIPHGMDRVLGTHRSGLDLPILPPMLGLVARAVLSTPEGRRRHIERVGTLFTNLFQPAALCVRARELGARISNVKMDGASPRSSPYFFYGASRAAQNAGDLCDRISKRAAYLAMQFAHLDEVAAPVPCPAFDANGVARIESWKPHRTLAGPNVATEMQTRDGRQVLRLRMTNEPLKVSLRTKVSLPGGNYRLTGSIKTFGNGDATNFLAPVIMRYSGERFGLEQRRLNGKPIDYSFGVSKSRAPEEIELACDIRDDASEVWFDAGSLRLTREEP